MKLGRSDEERSKIAMLSRRKFVSALVCVRAWDIHCAAALAFTDSGRGESRAIAPLH